jgi:hypothetical protein
MNPIVLQAMVDRVRRARHDGLTTERVIRSLSRAAAAAANRFARDADIVLLASRSSGFSEAMIGEAAQRTFRPITESALRDLVTTEFGCERGADDLPPDRLPRLIAHFLAGNVPPPGIVSICSGLLTKAANIVRVSSRDPVFPVVFANALRGIDPELAGTVELARWERADVASTRFLVDRADTVIAYGHDATIDQIRAMTGPSHVFVGYGQKVSVAVLTREALTPERLAPLTADIACDVSVYDQQGCLSPQIVYVETADNAQAHGFASMLATAMAGYQRRIPRGKLTEDEAAAVLALKTDTAFRAANDPRVGVWSPPGSLDWLVVLEPVTVARGTCLNRVIRVQPFDSFDDVHRSLASLRGKLSTVGWSDSTPRTSAWEQSMFDLGANRTCPVGQMQRPPVTWQHDGRPNVTCLLPSPP